MRDTVITMALIATTLCGCRTFRNDNIVHETYVHKYGVPIAKEDWSRNGREGQVVQLRNDGVTVAKSYEKGILHGDTTYSFPNSSVSQLVETYEQGNLAAKVENYPSGIAMAQECYNGGQITARTAWYEDGAPSLIEEYENGVVSQGEYHTPLNEVESRVTSGKGIRIVRGPEGELLFKDVLEGGVMIERTAYFPNGEPSAITAYQDGKQHGTRLTFSQGGLPKTAEEWANGFQHGMTTTYQNGEILAQVPYVKGKREGIEQRYHDGKVVTEEVTWKNDARHGPHRVIVDENTVKTEWYHAGEVVSRTTYERLNLR